MERKMKNTEKLIKGYLEGKLGLDKTNKTIDCPEEGVLIEYLNGQLNKERSQFVEHHLAGCGFCLSQLSLAYQSQHMDRQNSFEPASQKLIDKTKSSLGVHKRADKLKVSKTRSKKANFFLAGAIIPFILSFIFPKYFIQFLVVTFVLGIRWAFESEGGRTMIMVFDSWRHHSHDKDEEISQRLKNRF
jgi:hypothetical protein